MTRHRRRFGGLALVVGLGPGLLGGCAVNTRNAILVYPPSAADGVVPSALAETAPAARDVTITVRPFVDRRPDPTKVGNVRNTFGMKMAPIQTANSVPIWVQDALVLELRGAGFRAAMGDTMPAAGLAIEGEVLQAETDAYLTYGGKVGLLIRLRDGDRELLQQAYAGHGSGGTNWGSTSESYAQTLALALADAMRQVVADVSRSVSPP